MSTVKPELQLICDFVNTLEVEEGTDELSDAAGLGRWLRTRGLWAGRPDEKDAVWARELREALRDLMWVNNGGRADTEAASATIDGASRRSGVVVRFDDRGMRLVAPKGGIGAVVAAAGEAMADGSWQRLKACRSDSCRWAFVDNARNRSRQWCSMSLCGNREKARRYRRVHGDSAS
jgi:predicted RNA-binding Zn ribbon-like protein